MPAVEVRERAQSVKGWQSQRAQQAEGLMTLPRRVLWYPTDLIRPAAPDIWDGDVSLKKLPTTIDGAIQAATIHLTAMDVDSKGVDRKTAIRHVLIPPQIKDEAIDGDNPLVARRRLGEVPATLNAPALLQRFFREAEGEILSMRANTQLDATLRGDMSTPPHADVGRIRAQHAKRLERGENPDRVALEAIIDLVDAVWTARDERINHTRRQTNTHTDWMAKAADAEKEHVAELAADRPRGFDLRPTETREPHVVYEFAKYEHRDDPVG